MNDESNVIRTREVGRGVTLHVLVTKVELDDVRFATTEKVKCIMKPDWYTPRSVELVGPPGISHFAFEIGSEEIVIRRHRSA